MPMHQVLPWFIYPNIILGILFTVVTFIVSFYAYKHYKVTKESQLRLFSLSFLLFCLAYVVQVVSGFLIIDKMSENVLRMTHMHEIRGLMDVALNLHIFFYLLGLVLLVYMTLKVKKISVFLLLTAILGIAMVSTSAPLLTIKFHIIAALFFAFVAVYYYNNYKEKKNKTSLLVWVAFVLICISQIDFIFAVERGFSFVMGRLFELAGYICILINLIIITKK
ncbi:hypothetical protein K9M79_00155 [Candidatus Woesearchaeota archaeon]|nr:hypothetical protein [Candidatus Woesearchaeota archaeon]